MGEILPLNFEDCCFRYDLVIGCAIYVTVEVYMWAMMSLVSIYTEFKLIENHEISTFKNFTSSSSYYVTVFGNSSNNISRAVIFTQIGINGFLSVGIVLYCIFAVILLIGISEKNIGYFAPYLYLDTIFLYLSLIGVFASVLIQSSIVFRNSIIFCLKFYPSSCIYSLYKKIGGPVITFSNYSTIMSHPSPQNNPAIRLARCEDEFEDTSRQSSSNEFMRPRVSFQNVTEDFNQQSSSEPRSEPLMSPQIPSLKTETTALKTCFKKSLQLPVNNSYP